MKSVYNFYKDDLDTHSEIFKLKLISGLVSWHNSSFVLM
jgi:hypothetical protein